MARPRIGVLLLNFALASRAGIGDTAAWMADHVSSLGYPVFRFDVPGLGDSRGPAPEFGKPLWHCIRDGGHADCVAGLVGRLRKDYGLQGLVLGGLCAGAVTTIYAAARCEEGVQGLILLEPVFHRCEERPGKDPLRRRPAGPPPRPGHWQDLADRLRRHVSRTPPDHWMRSLHVLCKRLRDGIRLRLCPADANRPLLEAWKRAMRSGVPLLLVNSGVEGRVMHNLYYLGLNFRRWAEWRVVPETNHLMAAHGGKETVARYIGSWLTRRFPHAQPAPARLTRLHRGRPTPLLSSRG